MPTSPLVIVAVKLVLVPLLIAAITLTEARFGSRAYSPGLVLGAVRRP